MTLRQRLYRLYYDLCHTNTYTGRFLFCLLHTGVVKFTLAFVLVRFYRIRLETYATLAVDIPYLETTFLGHYLYAGRYSRQEVREAIFAARSPEQQQAWLQLQEDVFASFAELASKQEKGHS